MISLYVFLVLIFFFLSDGLSPEMVVIFGVSLIVGLVLAPVAVKGSYNAESIRSEPVRCSKSWNRKYTPSNISKNLSLLNSIYTLFKLSTTSPQEISLLRDEDIEAAKFLNLQDPISVPGLYYYLDAMTAFLQDSSCISYSYKPPTEVANLLKLSFYISLAFPVFLWCFRSTTYYIYCGASFSFAPQPDLPSFCVATTWQFVFLFGSILLAGCLMVLSLIYLTMLALILYTAHLLISLMKFWIQRYKVLRLVQKSDVEEELQEQNAEEANDSTGGGIQENPRRLIERRKTILRSVERDAHERYLLVHYFAQEISDKWGTFIACSLVINALCCVGGYFFIFIVYTKYQYIDMLSLMVLLFNAVTLLFIMITLAYANSNVDQLKSHFIQSADEDYSLIGGRAAWLQYIDQTPVHWTVLGLAVTPTWIMSIFFTVLTGVLGLLVS
jgi:hypothetical protein